MSEATSIATIFEDFAIDHTPDGWPAVQQKQLTEAALMLRKQHKAIVQLSAALIDHQKAGVGNSTDYKIQHAAYMGAHKALAETKDLT